MALFKMLQHVALLWRVDAEPGRLGCASSGMPWDWSVAWCPHSAQDSGLEHLQNSLEFPLLLELIFPCRSSLSDEV